MMMKQPEIYLTERQKQLLIFIIEEYVATARPVASELIVDRYNLNVSSATIRNEMVELERAGLIMHPHTSAGRVPTDRGYRYYVENLMTPASLTQNEQRKIRHQFHQIEMDADEWVRLATSVLARSVHNVALATAPRSTAVRLKHFELLSVADRRVLIVLVGHDGAVTQQMLVVEENWSQEQLSTLSTKLNSALVDKTAHEIEAWVKDEASAQDIQSMPALITEVLPALMKALSRLERPDASRIYREGLSHMLEQPEFHQPERVQQLLQLFEHDGAWSSLISSVLGQDGVQVIIGEEWHRGGMSSFSLVLARYGMENQMSGVLGVIGPMRMAYGRSVSTVQYMSGLLSDMLYRAHNLQLPERET
jgi:heat-inducible transcriptional repressor